MIMAELTPIIGKHDIEDLDELFDNAERVPSIELAVSAISESVESLEAGMSEKQDALTNEQMAAVNSGVTANMLSGMSSDIASKQNALTETQLNAVNSGVTSAKLSQIDHDLDANSTLVVDAINGETKNRLKLIAENSFGYGIHVSFEDDGTIIVDGFNSNKQATNNFNLDIAILGDLGLKDGETYTISDGLGTGSSATFGLRVVDQTGYVKKLWDSYEHPNMVYDVSDPDLYKLRLFVKSGVAMDHVVLKPMLCTKQSYDASSDFVPYESTEYDIPSYYNMPVIVDKIRNNIRNTGVNGKTFMFVTDIHWSTNNTKFSRVTPKLLSRLYEMDKRIDTCVLGGDYIDGGDHDTILRLMEECAINHTKGGYKTYALFGNHDQNTIYSTTVTPFTDAEFYGAVQAFNADDCVYGDYKYFHVDDTKTKTRMLFIDSGLVGDELSTEQSAWIDTMLSTTPSGWHILAFWHMIYHVTDGTAWTDIPVSLTMTDFSTEVCSKLDAHNASNSGSTVEAIIGGHVHLDKNDVTTGGIPIVCTTTSALGFIANGVTGEKGTITETAFDVMTIDYDNKTINCVRIGRGEDRTISYAT